MDYAVKSKSILITKDMGFANILMFPSHYGVIVLRLPFYFKAYQFVNVLREFFNSVDLKLLKKSLVIVKLGRYRIRKL